MRSFAFASFIHVSCRGKDNCSAMSGTERDQNQVGDVSVSKIKQISLLLALHLFAAVEDVSCLFSLLKRKCIAEYKEE